MKQSTSVALHCRLVLGNITPSQVNKMLTVSCIKTTNTNIQTLIKNEPTPEKKSFSDPYQKKGPALTYFRKSVSRTHF